MLESCIIYLIMKNSIRNLFNALFCFVAIFSLFFFISTFHSYRSHTPCFIGSMVEPFKEKGVHIAAKAYNSEECSQYLDRNLISKGYQPIQITIQNNTSKKYFLSSHGLDTPIKTPHQVASHISASAIPKSIALKVAGFVFWPLMIPSAIDSIFTIKSHLNMKHDYYAKSIKPEEETLIPYSTVHRIVFVEQEKYQETFTLYLKEEKNLMYHPFEVKINS